MALNARVEVQSVGGIASKAYKTSLMWSCHIIDFKTTVKNTEKNIRLILDMWAFGNINNSKLFEKTQIEKLGDLSKIDWVFISHVHNDHIGNLVQLVKSWYNGPIHMTHTSKDLLIPILEDILAIHKEEKTAIEEKNKRLGARLNRALSIVKSLQSNNNKNGNWNWNWKWHGKHSKEIKKIEYTEEDIANATALLTKYNIEKNEDIAKVMQEVTPLQFDEKDIMKTISQIISHDRDKKIQIYTKDWISLVSKLMKAWHVEGAAQTLLSFWYNPYNKQEQYKFLFSGDLWRTKEPLLLDTPVNVKEKVNATMIESTYGNRIHSERAPELKRFAEEVDNAKSSVIIPAFSLGRSIDVIYILLESIKNGDITLAEWEKIYIDGKLTKNLITATLKRNAEKYKFLADDKLHIIESDEERKNIYKNKWRQIIIGSWGMLQGWSAITHVHKIMDNPKAKILFVGFQAPWTRGHYLQNTKGRVYTFHRHKQMKNKLYHPVHTLEKIKNRWDDTITISGQSTKELEKILLDLYAMKDELYLWENEYIHVPEEFWEDERIKKELLTPKWERYNPPKYGPAKTILRTASQLCNHHPEVFDYFEDKIKVLEYNPHEYDEEIEEDQRKSLDDLKWIVIYRDQIGKKDLKAQLVHFSTFSGHADRDELVDLMEINGQMPDHTTILVHGEEEAAQEFKEHIEKNKHIKWRVIIGQLYDTLTFHCDIKKKK